MGESISNPVTDELAGLGIYNYHRLSEHLITSGQPSEEQLAAVARAGYEVVINLALHGEPYALADERATVEGLGMHYVHIPVIWQRPTAGDLEAFSAAMDGHAVQRVYVHCAANMRVSAFMLLYRVRNLGWPLAEALPDLAALWEPNQTWQAFIDANLNPPDLEQP